MMPEHRGSGCVCGPLKPGEYEADRASACFRRVHPDGTCPPDRSCGCLTSDELDALIANHEAEA